MSTEASNRELHWQRTKKLMIVHMVIWFIFSYVVHWFATDLNSMTFMHFPLGFYFAAQGSLAVFVVQLFFFSWQQHKIDVECGMAETETE
jgi:putative solute:sodium symporter small subunit